MNKRYFILIVSILVACVPFDNGAESARQVLIEFFELLHRGRFEEAAELYGGDYTVLVEHNPSLDPGERAALWENACAINGAQCLPLRSASLIEQDGIAYRFIVEFNNSDGSLFILGPCCGGTEEDFPPISLFEFRVMQTEGGGYLVMDLPVYIS